MLIIRDGKMSLSGTNELPFDESQVLNWKAGKWKEYVNANEIIPSICYFVHKLLRGFGKIARRDAGLLFQFYEICGWNFFRYGTSDAVLKFEIKIHNYGDYNEDGFLHFIKDITLSGVIEKTLKYNFSSVPGTAHRTIY